MVTGFASLENAIKSLNAGASAYVMKPVNPKNLLDTINEKIAEQDAEEEITGEKVSDWAADQLLRISWILTRCRVPFESVPVLSRSGGYSTS